MKKTTKTLSALAGLALIAGSTHAATITGVTIEDVSSEIVNLVPRDAVFTVDGSGFNEISGFHSTSPNNTMWTSAGNIGGEPGSPDPLSGGVQITWDLEGNYDLSSLKLWNFNENTNTLAGIKDVVILVAASEGGSFTSLGGFVFTQAPGAANVDFGQVVDLTSFAAADNTRLVRFNITTNHGFTSNGGLVGISEIRFDGTVVPEPGSLALLGLGGLLIARRRRSK